MISARWHAADPFQTSWLPRAMRDNLEQTLESTRRIAEVVTRVANEASQMLTVQSKKAHRAG